MRVNWTLLPVYEREWLAVQTTFTDFRGTFFMLTIYLRIRWWIKVKEWLKFGAFV